VGVYRLISLLLISGFWHSSSGQGFTTLSALPGELHESSGIEVINPNTFISHNDGGDKAQLYIIDSSGTILRTVFVQNAVNVDWEDMTMAPDGRVFIGNFGNNGHNRKDLEILVLPKYEDWTTDTIMPTVITFSFSDQTQFPPAAENHVFDCEALAFYQDSLYVFNKNWSSPFSGYVKMYVLPAHAGDFSVKPRDSVSLGSIREISWVTGADIADSNLYLVGSAFVWKFKIKDNVFLDNPTQIMLNHFSQKEAISVWGNQIYITDESTGGFGNLYRYDEPTSQIKAVQNKAHGISIKQLHNGIQIENPLLLNMEVTISALDGKTMISQMTKTSLLKIEKKSEDAILSPGIYVLHINTDTQKNIWTKVWIGP
jgi:hypothetical protein